MFIKQIISDLFWSSEKPYTMSVICVLYVFRNFVFGEQLSLNLILINA